jgi:outer membrane protein assembly factor BamD (BamD/ComL family)
MLVSLFMRKSLRISILQIANCALLFVACATTSVRGDWFWSRWFSDPPAVNTPEWWKKNKHDAVFEPGKGWKVPGVDGYFDQDGRPMEAPPAVERVSQAAEASINPQDEGLLPGIDPAGQFKKLQVAVGLGPNETIARDAYTRGTEAFNAGDYSAAADAFAEATNRGVNAPFEQDAMFMLAESYFFGDRYIKARDAYDALITKFPNTRYRDALIEREWNIARYWDQYEAHDPDWILTANAIDKTRPWFDTIGHAIKTYDNIRLNDPTGPRADDAIMATANIYFRRRLYDDADYHYTLLRREYPRSELQFEAHLLGLQAKLHKYQGPDYDGTPIEEAQKLVKQIQRQFAARLSPEDRERLRTEEARLARELALRDYRMAEYFDGIKHYGSAQMYYARVMERHPETELAMRAKQRITEIAGRPPEPSKPLGPLVELLPTSKQKAQIAKIPEVQQGKTRLAQGQHPTSQAGAAAR